MIGRGGQRCKPREERLAGDRKRIVLAGDESLLAEISAAYESWTGAGSPQHWQLQFAISAEYVRFPTNIGTEFRTSVFTPRFRDRRKPAQGFANRNCEGSAFL